MLYLIWLLFALFSALLAYGKNRNVFGWFLVGTFFGPFGLLVAFLPKLKEGAVRMKSPDQEQKPKLVCQKDDDATWAEAKKQLFKEMDKKGFSFVIENSEKRYTLKKDAQDKAHVNLERREGKIFADFFNVEAVDLALTEQCKKEYEADISEQDNVQSSPSIADEIEKLRLLKEKGILTEKEFMEYKSKMLR